MKSKQKEPSKTQSQSLATSSKKRKISHAGARQKGLDFEREVAKMLRHIYPKCERQLEFQQSQAAGVDLRGTDPYKIQCKRKARYDSILAIEEVVTTSPNDVPVLITKGDKKKPVAVLYLDDFIKILEKLNGVINVDDLI